MPAPHDHEVVSAPPARPHDRPQIVRGRGHAHGRSSNEPGILSAQAGKCGADSAPQSGTLGRDLSSGVPDRLRFVSGRTIEKIATGDSSSPNPYQPSPAFQPAFKFKAQGVHLHELVAQTSTAGRLDGPENGGRVLHPFQRATFQCQIANGFADDGGSRGGHHLGADGADLADQLSRPRKNSAPCRDTKMSTLPELNENKV